MKNTRVLLILALAAIFGLAAGYSALNYLRNRPAVVEMSPGGETVSAILASRDLGLGTVLEDSDLQVVEWPAGSLPIGIASSKDELVGRSLLAEVKTNEAILSSKLADTGQRGIIPLIPTGMRAVSVATDEVIAVSGFVTPQTRVDVILVMEPPGASDVMSKVILQNIQTVAAGEEIRETEDGTPVTVQVVTLLVTPAEAERLALAETEGDIRLALRNTLDMEAVETSGERASRLFAGGLTRITRPASRGGVVTVPTARESIVEIYRGGVKTLVRY